MAGVWRQELCSLQTGTQNSILIGVIIHSGNPKNFESSNSRFGFGGQRGVWTFTLRDSPDDFINVTVWGSTEYINSCFNSYRIGSVVEIINGKVISRRPDDPNEMFVPTVTSQLKITMNEGNSLIQCHDSEDSAQYEPLFKLPTKGIDSLRSLKYVLENIEELRDQFIDLLVVVTFIGEVRDIISRDGRSFKCRTFEVSDASTEKAISLQLWDTEWIRLSELWVPRKTVLFLADARVGYDSFKKKTTISIARKTLITENPNVQQAMDLRLAILNRPEFSPSDPYSIPNPKNITTVMTVQQISHKLNARSTGNDERVQFFAILYASITELNLDSKDANLLLTKCALCKRMVQKDHDSCMNLECPSGNGSREPYNLVTFNVKLNLKDDTGYLVGCRLMGKAAEDVFGCTATEFQAMNTEQRMELKWKYLLSKFGVRMQVLGPTATMSRSIYNILHMERFETTEDISFDDIMDPVTNH